MWAYRSAVVDVGHLVGLADAAAYDEKYTKWRYEDLPIVKIKAGIAAPWITVVLQQAESGGAASRHIQRFPLLAKLELLTKPLIRAMAAPHHALQLNMLSRKEKAGYYPAHFTILFRLIAIAASKQCSSAASRPRRYKRCRLCLAFCAANVPSHHKEQYQACRCPLSTNPALHRR